MSTTLSPQRIAEIRRVLDAAVTEMGQCENTAAKPEYISINACFQPGEDPIIDKTVMRLPELVALLDCADDWTNGMAAKDAEIARLRSIIDRAHAALMTMFPGGLKAKCGPGGNARIALETLEEAKPEGGAS